MTLKVFVYRLLFYLLQCIPESDIYKVLDVVVTLQENLSTEAGTYMCVYMYIIAHKYVITYHCM